MKKIVSFLMTVLMFAAMLTVFAVPAFAKETKTADDYLAEAVQFESEGKYEEAAEAYMKAGDCYAKANDWNNAQRCFGGAARLYDKDLRDPIHAADAYRKSGNCCVKLKDWDTATTLFGFSGDSLENSDPAEAAVSYLLASKAARLNGNANSADTYYKSAMDLVDAIFAETSGNHTGSTLSEGSLVIIVGVACSVVFLAVGFFIGRKKKKPAVAGAAESDE